MAQAAFRESLRNNCTDEIMKFETSSIRYLGYFQKSTNEIEVPNPPANGVPFDLTPELGALGSFCCDALFCDTDPAGCVCSVTGERFPLWGERYEEPNSPEVPGEICFPPELLFTFGARYCT